MPTIAPEPSTLFEKIWHQHVVLEREDGQTLLYIDRHYLGDDLPADTFSNLARRMIPIRRPNATFASPDHYAPTSGREMRDVVDDDRRAMIQELRTRSERAGITHFGLDDPRQGIVHIVGPEQGLTLPGMTVVCGDSHTATHGALGSFGLGIGASEVSHVLATQTLWQRKPSSMRVRVMGHAAVGVTAKDIILYLIQQIGSAGASGHVIEYQGKAITALTMEGRMTLCNMSIEAGARAGLIAPDETTFSYIHGRPYAPSGAGWDESLQKWRQLYSDADATFEADVTLDISCLSPMISWGTSPAQSCPIDSPLPNRSDLETEEDRTRFEAALAYMGLTESQRLIGLPIDRVFIGSCTNGRIEDLRLAANMIQGRQARVPTMVVPGSGLVKRQAEAEGLHHLFIAAGMQWHEPGCSMCLAINGDSGLPGERCVSTTNRNFVGRQGRGVRTHLVNPGMAASAAIHGCIVDYREDLAHASI